jgi:hypothetical protein
MPLDNKTRGAGGQRPRRVSPPLSHNTTCSLLFAVMIGEAWYINYPRFSCVVSGLTHGRGQKELPPLAAGNHHCCLREFIVTLIITERDDDYHFHSPDTQSCRRSATITLFTPPAFLWTESSADVSRTDSRPFAVAPSESSSPSVPRECLNYVWEG